MSAGLYTGAEIARYFGCRAQEVSRMMDEEALPYVKLPGAAETVRKITLHGLHRWLKKKHTGEGAFMSVEELQAEIAAANAGGGKALEHPGLKELRLCFEALVSAAREQMERRAA